MITTEQMSIIVEQTNAENANEFVKALLSYYCDNNISNIMDLLSYIPDLAKKSISIKQDSINQYNWATNLLLAERYHYPITERKTRKGSKKSNRFPTLLYTCIAHFPDGDIEHFSIVEKDFFEEFLDYLKNKRGFDYNSAEDWKWLKVTTGRNDWLTGIIRRYIDKEFVPPTID